jgi:hypothetical protein
LIAFALVFFFKDDIKFLHSDIFRKIFNICVKTTMVVLLLSIYYFIKYLITWKKINISCEEIDKALEYIEILK